MVIAGNVITYDNFPDAFSWRPQNETISALCTAVVTTFLSYQLIATIHDLFFGMKHRGSARISDFPLFLLTNSSSPSFVFRSILSRGAALQEPGCSHKIVIAKLSALLVIGPAISVFMIVASLETTTTLTFADAGFRGMAVGFDQRALTPSSEQAAARMSRFPLRTAWQDTPLVGFVFRDGDPMFGQSHTNDSYLGTGNGTAVIVVGKHPTDGIGLHVEAPNVRVVVAATAGAVWKHNNRTTEYYLAPSFDARDAKNFADYSEQLIWEWCGGKGSPVKFSARIPPQNLALRTIRCESQGTLKELARLIDEDILSRLTFVNSPNLLIATKKMIKEAVDANRDPMEAFVDGMNMEFLRRRNSRVSLFVMTIALGTSVFLRLIVSAITNNDISMGIGLICREVLGLSWCDSMTAVGVDVEFDQGTNVVEIIRNKVNQREL